METAMFKSELESEGEGRTLGRRKFLFASGAAVAGFVVLRYWKPTSAQSAPALASMPKEVSIVEFTDSGERKGIQTVATIQKTDAEWRKQLSADSYEITRHAGTERPFTGDLLDVHDKGVFRCICCDTALYSSATKFDSGTGWPSFWAPIAKENVVESEDRSLFIGRTAVSCRRCDAHLGHVFEDGPEPTGLRYCMNSVAMRFAKG
jgi:peptide-methionine (R)-S-oxide reductase